MAKSKVRRVSETVLRDIIKANPGIDRAGLVKALNKDKIVFNDPMLDGLLLMAGERWLADDNGKLTVRVASKITELFKVSNPMDPANATIESVPYDREAEQNDPLLKRSKTQAVKAAKTHWYREGYKATLAAWDKLAASAKSKK